MTLEWKYNDDSVDWNELSALYRAAPLGDKQPMHLQKVFANSMFKCFVYEGSKLVAESPRVLRRLFSLRG